MKKSIRRQILTFFIFVMSFSILLCLILNNIFLEKYYLQDKQKKLLKAYEAINLASSEGSLDTEKFEARLWDLCAIYNINVIVIDSDAKLIQSAGMEHQFLVESLLNRVFSKNHDGIVTLKESEHYSFELEHRPHNNVTNIQMWGTLDNGNLFMISSVVESIRDSVGVSNRFLLYIAFISLLISIGFSVYFTEKIAKPIRSLTNISKKMTNLDFETHYEGDEQNEIGELGQHINILSEKLEKTISELKTANNELLKDIENKEQIDEMRREFLSNVSHELKTPLALIMGYAEGLKENVNDDVDSRQFYCDVIIDESNKMNVMVKKLLTLNQIEFGKTTISMERFNICELIRNYLINSDILIKQADANVIFEPDRDYYVWSDEFQIQEVFANYFSNSLNHLDFERRVEIKVVPMEEQVRIVVFNTGQQIPEESLPHLFEKFYKVDKARTREYGGSGVGLSIVKAIMDSIHQGYGVKNCENGVEFWFELPLK